MHNRLNQTSLFLVENHPEKNAELIASLKRAGLDDNYFIYKNNDLYIKTDGTKLVATLTEDKRIDCSTLYYDLFCGNKRLCGTKRVMTATDTSTISYFNSIYIMPKTLFLNRESAASTVSLFGNTGTVPAQTSSDNENIVIFSGKINR